MEGNWQFSPLPHNEERQVYESWLPSLMRLIMCIYFSSVFIFVSCVLCLWIISKVKHLLWYVFNSGGPRRLAIYLPIILTCLYEFVMLHQLFTSEVSYFSKQSHGICISYVFLCQAEGPSWFTEILLQTGKQVIQFASSLLDFEWVVSPCIKLSGLHDRPFVSIP